MKCIFLFYMCYYMLPFVILPKIDKELRIYKKEKKKNIFKYKME